MTSDILTNKVIIMKASIITVYLGISMILLLFAPSYLFARAEETTEETYSLNRDGNIYLKNVSGDIVVKSWDRNEIKIIATKTARSKKDLDKVNIDIDATDNAIKIITRHQKPFGQFLSWFSSSRASVHYELTIPDKAQLEIESVSGSVRTSSIGGYLDIETVSGSIRAIAAQNGVRCESVSGSINLGEVIGDADLETVSGSISVKKNKGSINTETVSGSIRLSSFSLAEDIRADSVSGSIKLQGELSLAGDYRLESISGGINLTLPSDSEFELNTKTTSGYTDCDFDILISGKIDRKKLNGVVGKGGARLSLSTISGSIRIIKDH